MKGMSAAVQRALLGADRTLTPEAVKCRCSDDKVTRYVLFTTDEIGRTVERCPTGRCWRGNRRITPDGNELAAQRNAQLLDAAKAEAKKSTELRNRERKFGTRRCERDGCGKEFVPRLETSRYCSAGCAGASRGKNRMQGVHFGRPK